MSGLLILIPIAVLMGLGALVAFMWALRSGQYEDLEGAGERIFEDDAPASRGTPAKATSSTPRD